MRRVGMSKSALVALLVAAIALVPTPAQGDEYDLNIPSGGNEQAPSGGDPGGGGEPTEEAAPTAPVTPAAPVAPVPTTDVPLETEIIGAGGGGGKEPESEQPQPVFGSTSLNATIGPQKIPRLKVPEREEGSSIVPLGLAGLAGLCCLLAVWRLRYRRELPTAPTPPPPPKPATATSRPRPTRESPASARVRGRSRPATKATPAQRRRTARGAASS